MVTTKQRREMSKLIRIKTEHVRDIKTLFEVLKEILSDTTIEFLDPPIKKKKQTKSEREDDAPQFRGMRILTISPEKTVLICLKLRAKQFGKFECKNEKYEIGVNLVQLNKMLKMADNEDEIEMYVDSDNIQELVLSVSNENLKRTRDFKLKLMDIDPTQVKPPNVESDVMITMNASEFHKICKDMAQIGQYLEIKCTNNTLIFTCEGDNGSCDTRYATTDDGVKIMFCNQNKQLIIQGIYELRHLNLFSKCANLSNDIQLLMKVTKFPLVITYTVATLGEFIACVAPADLKEKKRFEDVEQLYQSDEDVNIKEDAENA